MTMKNIIVMMMCLVALFSCSSDNDTFGGKYKVEEPIIEKAEVDYLPIGKSFRLMSVCDFQFGTIAIYNDDGKVIYEGIERFVLHHMTDNLQTAYYDDVSNVTSIHGSTLWSIPIKDTYTYTITKDNISLGDNFIDGIKKFYNGVIQQRAEQAIFKNKNLDFTTEYITKVIEDKYKPILDELIPTTTVGKIKKDDYFVTITLKCASGEKDFVFHIE